MEDAQKISFAMADERNINITQTINAIRKQLLGFIKARVNSPEDAEDILQDVFFQLAGNTEPIEQVTGWLYTVARNKITDRYRKNRLPLAEDVFGNSESDEGIMEWQEFLLPGDGNPESEYIRNFFWEELENALKELPDEQREAFVQNELEGRTFKDMEHQTGISVATLISRKRYAVLHLRERLNGLKDELLNY